MYKVELDMHLIFEPLMDADSPGIVLTRTIELPFVPLDGMQLYRREWDCCWASGPHGFKVRDVIYDLDRGVFVGTIRSEYCDSPIATLDAEIASYLETGWRLGSYYDGYRQRLQEGEDEPLLARIRNLQPAEDPYNDLDIELVQTLPAAKRPKEFNALFKALIREMASSYLGEVPSKNPQTAYALDKMGRYPKPAGMHQPNPDDEREWHEKREEFEQMSFKDKRKWLRKVERYPALATVVWSEQPPQPALASSS